MRLFQIQQQNFQFETQKLPEVTSPPSLDVPGLSVAGQISPLTPASMTQFSCMFCSQTFKVNTHNTTN